jgi:hypothetical protein
VTGYGLDDRGDAVGVPAGQRNFTSPYRPERLWSPPVSCPVNTGAPSAGREADHPPHLYVFSFRTESNTDPACLTQTDGNEWSASVQNNFFW